MGKTEEKLTVAPLLFSTLGIQSKSGVDGAGSKMMEEYILRTIEEMGGITVEVDDRNIYATKGETDLYPCVVCHTDTVHALIKNYIVVRAGYLYMGVDLDTGKQVGVGGDDKVGVAIALACLRDMENVKAVFFRDEEIGCIGASKAKLDFFKDVSFVLEADRQGMHDVVTNISNLTLVSKDFILEADHILTNHNRVWTADGRPTDVGTLKDIGMDVCALNLSCGYYNPHGPSETVSFAYVDATYAFMRQMFAELGVQRWPHVAEKPIVVPAAKAKKVPSHWPDEEYFQELLWGEEHSLEYAWQMRAEVRHDAIIAKAALPYNQYAAGGLMLDDVDDNGLPVSIWVLSRQDRHVVKRVPNIADLPYVSCPCCQYIGSLETSWDEDRATATVACDFCGYQDVVIIEAQEFVGDFVTKSRRPVSEKVPSSIVVLRDHKETETWQDRRHKNWDNAFDK